MQGCYGRARQVSQVCRFVPEHRYKICVTVFSVLFTITEIWSLLN